MTTIPVLLLLGASAALGLYLGLLYLRGVRKPVLIGTHLLLGAGGLEQLVMVMRGVPNGDTLRAGTFGTVAAGLLVAAMATGLAAPLLAGRSRRGGEAVLVAHICAGLAGFVIFVSWISSL
jgi:hypothetical protein